MSDEQRTEDWFTARLGRVTASRVSDVMAKTRSGPAASRKNYMMELLCQRLTRKHEEGYVSAAMQHGVDNEPLARSEYEFRADVIVFETGFVIHPDIDDFGASPDGLISDDGVLEIKCPNTAQHVEFLRTQKPDTKYQWQMLAQMACTGRSWADFVSYDPRMPLSLQYACVRFERDDKRIEEMESGIRKFLEELDALEKEMLERMDQLKAA